MKRAKAYCNELDKDSFHPLQSSPVFIPNSGIHRPQDKHQKPSPLDVEITFHVVFFNDNKLKEMLWMWTEI